MNEPFELPVTYKEEELLFPAQLKHAYTYHIAVNSHGQEVYFEPDDERNYRAIIEEEKLNKQGQVLTR